MLFRSPLVLALRRLNANETELRYETLRGFYHQLQSALDLSQPFTNEPGGPIQSLDTVLMHTNQIVWPQKYFRVLRTVLP